MENFEYYLELVRMSYGGGLTQGELAKFSRYKENKRFSDADKVLKQGQVKGESDAHKLERIALELRDVLEIDTRLFDHYCEKSKVSD